MESRTPVAAELWERLSTPTREAMRSLIQHYEQRLAQYESRIHALEQRLGVEPASPLEAHPGPAGGESEKEHSHRHRKHRQKIVVDEAKHRRHRRKKLLRLLAKVILWPVAVGSALWVAWSILVKMMGFMASAGDAGQ